MQSIYITGISNNDFVCNRFNLMYDLIQKKGQLKQNTYQTIPISKIDDAKNTALLNTDKLKKNTGPVTISISLSKQPLFK